MREGGGRKEGREGGMEGGREGVREGGTEGGREGRREGGMEGTRAKPCNHLVSIVNIHQSSRRKGIKRNIDICG